MGFDSTHSVARGGIRKDSRRRSWSHRRGLCSSSIVWIGTKRRTTFDLVLRCLTDDSWGGRAPRIGRGCRGGDGDEEECTGDEEGYQTIHFQSILVWSLIEIQVLDSYEGKVREVLEDGKVSGDAMKGVVSYPSYQPTSDPFRGKGKVQGFNTKELGCYQSNVDTR